MKIGVINNGLGNVGSVVQAFKFYKKDVTFIDNPESLEETDIIVLAGVGNFEASTQRLKDLNLWEALDEHVRVLKKPTLGICLGMQLFADISYENGENTGFGWVKGEVVKIKEDHLKVPHIGWDEIEAKDNNLFKGMLYNSFYFMHSYHFMPHDTRFIKATVNYGDLKMVAAVKKDNIYGVQFHPEKSQGDGLRFLKNFLEDVL